MSFRLVYEAVVAFTLVFFATAFAVTWKDCGEITRSRFSFTSGIVGDKLIFPVHQLSLKSLFHSQYDGKKA